MKRSWVLFVAVLALCALGWIPAEGASPFFLKNGDRVCFYGASITEQRFYPVDVETYVLTRFPHLHVRFMNSGVGGDGVAGGWAGPINLRLKRDVFPFRPTVVTINDLPLNDTQYRPFNPAVYQAFKKGYIHIITSLQAHLPGVRIVLIEPEPYDDVTHTTRFPGGVNGVLLKYCKFIRKVAVQYHLLCVNMNTPVVNVLKAAQAVNPKLAKVIIPGRLHPSAAGQLVMAQALLTAMGARSVVTSVTINAAPLSVVKSENTLIHGLSETNGTLTWTQHDAALPMPIMSLHNQWPQFPPIGLWPAPAPNMKYTNSVTALTVKLSGFIHAVDRQPLRVTHLTAAEYELRIDGQAMGKFSRLELAHGINLATLPTPMLSQAYRVQALAWQRTETWFTAWRQVELPMANIGQSPQFIVNTNSNPAARYAVNNIMRALSRLQHVVIRQERLTARPLPRKFQLQPVGHSVARNRKVMAPSEGQ